MKKSITKKAKRPKSVLQKAWETRRKAKREAAFEMVRTRMSASGLSGPEKATLTSGTAIHRSKTNSIKPENNPAAQIKHMLDVHRTEQLCSFLGDISAMRQDGQMKGHYPIMVSRTQINAVEDFLRDHGYGPWGKRSESLMSVSTKPTTT